MKDYRFDKVLSIKYKNPRRIPVKLIYDSEKQLLVIDANVSFSRSLLKNYINRKNRKSKNRINPIADDRYTFADMCELGITRKWSGEYDMTPWGGPSNLKVEVKFNRADRNEVGPKSSFIKIQRAYGNGTSFVTSPVWRWFWGLLRGNKECFVTLNWSPRFPGTINMNKYYSKNFFQGTSAHEFGHVLGLGDAYDAFYRFFYSAPGTEDYIMRYNRNVAPEEIMMAIYAHYSGKMQYFPCNFDSEMVLNTIKKRLFNNR